MSFAVSLVLGTAGLVVALVILSRIFVNVGAMEIAVKERRYVGRKMPSGRVVAMEGEVGIQADILKPGLHLVRYPFERVVRKAPLVEIASDELGIVEAIDGEPMPADRVFAPDRARHAHNDFQDPAGFIKHGGVKGIQLRTLPPGLRPIHPYLFRVSIAKATVVPRGKVGVVIAADGEPVDSGRILARAITGHRKFTDAEEFILSGGQTGMQVEILTPGTYRIHTDSVPISGDGRRRPGLFSIELHDATVIQENQIGLVEALDGAPLEPESRAPISVEGHDNFQDGREFVARGGRRGPQREILLPGTYYINPRLFRVVKQDIGHPSGGVAGVRGGLHGYRGAPVVQLVAERPSRMGPSSSEIADTFDLVDVNSSDGFAMRLEVRVVLRVPHGDGAVEELNRNVVRPLVDSIFRNQASESPATSFLENRHREQRRAEARIRAHLSEHHVDVVGVRICQIHLPEELMKRSRRPSNQPKEPRVAPDLFDPRVSKAGRFIPVLLLVITTKGLGACLTGIEQGSYLDSTTWGIVAAFAGACFLIWYGLTRR
jgi:hypothetical protein